MGMFDSVNVRCPECEAVVEFQSKAGACNLSEYSTDRVPLVIALSLHNTVEVCGSCNSTVQISYDIAPRMVRMNVECV